MALFKTTKKTTKSAKAKAPAKASKEIRDVSGRLENVLKAPWLSEKALIGTEKGIYVFAVPPEATKKDIAQAVEKIYKVTPKKISVVNLPGKRKPMRSKRGFGRRAARHKAYVHLKKGDTIQFA